MSATSAGGAAPRIRLSTRFGGFEADPRVLLSFPQGLPGYEQCRQFLLLASDSLPHVHCLHAVSGPRASFLVMDPRLVDATYRAVLPSGDADRLQAARDDELLWLAILTFDDQDRAFANLRAPVVINPARMLGLQVLSTDSSFPLRHPVAIG